MVEALGPGVVGFRMGDEVYSRPDLARDGAYADYIVIRASEAALKPRTLDHIHAAAMPLAALTAWQALFDAADLQEGQKVLIHGGAGGVGSFAVQLAKWKGAVVAATASAGNQEFLRDLGADQAVDYRGSPFEETVCGVDVVLDTIGGETQKRSWKSLRRGGIMVSTVNPPSDEDALLYGARKASVWVQSSARQLAELAALVDSGELRPFVETILPLAQARRAQEISQTGHARGKIVLRVAPPVTAVWATVAREAALA